MSYQIIEPIIVAKHVESVISKAKPSEIHKFMAFVAVDSDLVLKRQGDYDKALEILINQVKNN